MTTDFRKMTVPTITNDGRGPSVFSTLVIELSGEISRQLSGQIGAVNFRLRCSVREIEKPQTSVMLAQAGIHSLAKKLAHRMIFLITICVSAWIPTFVGMTGSKVLMFSTQ